MPNDHLPALPSRAPDSHKGSFGRVLLIAGSRGMTGAAVLAGSAALRAGAGLVYVATPSRVVDVVASFEPSYLTVPLVSDGEGRWSGDDVANLVNRPADAVAIGPGLGQSDLLREAVATLVRSVTVPLVIDADGLNLLVGQTDLLRKRPAPTVLTPHVGEFARLSGHSAEQILAGDDTANAFAKEHGVILALKRPRVHITDGRNNWHNRTGNPGMATGGSGDVLTGVLVALLAQGMKPWEATLAAAHLHGSAGDLAAAERGEVSLIARDLLETLPPAIVEYVARAESSSDIAES